MSWMRRVTSMVIIVAVYLLVIRPNVSPGVVRSVSDLMVGIGVFLFGLAYFITVMSNRES